MSNHQNILSGSKLAKNTIYNMLGLGSPVVIAIFLLPILIKGMGDERFGILSIGWVVIGYFSLFDFGIGRALTKIVSEKLGQKKPEDIPDVFWTSMLIMLIVSALGTIIVILFTPILVEKVFTISPALIDESYAVFYTLAAAIPVVTLTAGLRGVLESYQKFGIISIIRTALGAFTFVGPAITLLFTNDLFWIILIIVLFRIIIFAVFFYYCFQVNPGIKNQIHFKKSSIKPLIAFGTWITVSNLISPIMTYIDRFVIGVILTIAAVTYYTTPFEVVTKFLIFPTAIIGVLFPAFSAGYFENKEFVKKLFFRGSKYIYIVLFPVSILFILFANEFLLIWIGKDFADKSSLVFQLLALGVLFNSLAYVPFTYIQGIGRPEITGKLHLIELPIYIILLGLLVKMFGINGAAFTWFIRCGIDAVIVYFLSLKFIESDKRKVGTSVIILVLTLVACTVSFLIPLLIYKIIFFVLFVTIFIALTWIYLLDGEEKSFIILKSLIIKSKS